MSVRCEISITQVVREETAKVGGVTASVFTSGFGGNIKQIQIQLRGDDAESLLKNADRAMYRAKESGRDTFQFASAAGVTTRLPLPPDA